MTPPPPVPPQDYLDAPPGVVVPKVKKQAVVDMVTKGVVINLTGLASTLLGVQVSAQPAHVLCVPTLSKSGWGAAGCHGAVRHPAGMK